MRARAQPRRARPCTLCIAATARAALSPLCARAGGFDIIGSGRDKIETPEQFAASRAHVESLRLDGLVVIGGDDSNTNAALLAEYFAAHGVACRVVGCPKTIDGDLKVPEAGLDISFGFDTACKTYSELIGNICLDTLSSGKYYNFVRLMGRAASNITLECALQTHPTLTLLGEEVAARKQNLASITEELVAVIVARAAAGKNYGVILVPEGLIEFVPEVSVLLKELNELLATGAVEATPATVGDALSPASAALFAYLPAGIKKQLLAERDPHGNVQVSLIETEKLLAELVAHELGRLRKLGRFAGTFSHQSFFLGYEGRCGTPSDFDAAYCFALGATAAALLAAGQTGMMSSVTNLGAPVEEWACGGVPLTVMMNIERRHGKDKPVIRKWLVDLKGAPFRAFVEARGRWAYADCFRCPGPIQLDTAPRTRDTPPPPGGSRVDPLCFTLALELADRAAPPHAAAGAPLTPPPVHDVAGHRSLCEGLLTTGLAALTPTDMQRVAICRAAHGISDEEHYSVLAQLGCSAADWKGAEIRAAQVQAHSSSSS